MDDEIYKTYHGWKGDYTITEKQWNDRHKGSGMAYVCTGKLKAAFDDVEDPIVLPRGTEVKIKIAKETKDISIRDSSHTLWKEAYVLRSIVDNIKREKYSIVSYIDQAKPNEEMFLAMEHLGGQSLEDYIGRHLFNQKLDEKIVIKFSKEIARSLDFLHSTILEHEVGILHRDLKPANLMIVKRGGEEHCIMIDFGTEKRDWKGGGMTIHGKVGTEGYSCPHQFAGQPASAECDLYALGRIMFFMATGEEPSHHTAKDANGNDTHMKQKASDLKGVGYNLSELIDELISLRGYPRMHKIQTAGRVLERLWGCPIPPASQSSTIPPSKSTATTSQLPLEPHIILGSKRISIINGRCEIGREHKCPEIEEWSRKKVKPDCSRGVIHSGLAGFKWPIGLTSRKNQTNIQLPLTPMGNSSEPKSIADAHHMRIWKKEGKWVVMDLDTDAWTAIHSKGRWYPLPPLNPVDLDEDYVKLAIGFTMVNGPEIEFTFYKQ